jgi:DNA-binding PadR family transcriptional regulator
MAGPRLLRAAHMLYIVLHMADSPPAGLEAAILLAVVQLGSDAYGATVRREVSARRGREYTVGAIHTTLQRLEDKGLLVSWTGEPLPVRGGRARRYFRLTAAGVDALDAARSAARRLWEVPGFGPDFGLEPT